MNDVLNQFKNILYAIRTLFNVSPKYFILYFTITTVTALVQFAPVFFWRELLNLLEEAVTSHTAAYNTMTSVSVAMGLYGLVLLLGEVLKRVERIVSYRYNDEIVYGLDNIMLNKLADMDLAFFDSSALRDKAGYANQTMGQNTKNMVISVHSLLTAFVSFVMSVILISQLGLEIAIILIIFALPAIIGGKRINRWEYAFEKEHMLSDRKLNYYSTIFSGDALQEIKVYQLKDYFINLYHAQWLTLYHARKALNKKNFIVVSITELLGVIGDWAVYTAVVGLFLTGAMDIGSVAYFISILFIFRGNFSNVFRRINDISGNSMRLDDVRTFMDLEPLVEKSGERTPGKNPKIEFVDVSFKYLNVENWVLYRCSFVINPGEKIGLVGLNGSGKSTIVKLICRFYDPTEGQILLDGIDAREYDIVKMRELYSALFQTFCIYCLSLRENIAIANLNHIDNDKALIDACDKSGVSDFIRDWEKGLDEQITRWFSPDGKELSLGQKQRVALARAFFRNAPFVLLDEPSASLDAVAEHEVFTKFLQLSEQKGAMLISHRLSSITLTDKILMLENGEIIEQGSHDELLNKNGRYAYLFNLQASKYR